METDVQKEMDLLIKIVLYLLLAVAFLSNYAFSSIVPHDLLIFFMFGALILVFAFTTYKRQDSHGYKILTYLCVVGFIIFFFSIFLQFLNVSLGPESLFIELPAYFWMLLGVKK